MNPRKVNGKQTPTYTTWCSMVARCTRPSSDRYKFYGARGITVCERWLSSYDNFILDMGERPAGRTLERIDNSRGYEPGNCRWATAKEQQNNTRKNVLIDTPDGRMTIAQADGRFGLSAATLYARHAKGLPPGKVLAPITRKRNLCATINGKTKTLKQWAADTGVSYKTILRRFSAGLSGDAIIAKPYTNPYRGA